MALKASFVDARELLVGLACSSDRLQTASTSSQNLDLFLATTHTYVPGSSLSVGGPHGAEQEQPLGMAWEQQLCNSASGIQHILIACSSSQSKETTTQAGVA